MLCGLPGSGKSTYAEKLKNDNYIVLSSDQMRIELYGDINHQDNNGELFQELYRRAKQYLNQGFNVVIDATNINQRRRIHFVNEFKKFNKEIIYFNTPYQECYWMNFKRDRKVPHEVMDRMYKTLHIPIVEEGWDKIIVVHFENDYCKDDRRELELLIQQDSSYEALFELLNDYKVFNDIYELPHDSSYHSFSVSRHTYHVWRYVLENYYEEDRLIMLWAALLHDIGKAKCKNFKDGSRYANFIGHENVSAQLAFNYLRLFGYEDDFILKVAKICLLHMKLLNVNDDERDEKLFNFVGEETYNKLLFFKKADVQAK